MGAPSSKVDAFLTPARTPAVGDKLASDFSFAPLGRKCLETGISARCSERKAKTMQGRGRRSENYKRPTLALGGAQPRLPAMKFMDAIADFNDF